MHSTPHYARSHASLHLMISRQSPGIVDNPFLPSSMAEPRPIGTSIYRRHRYGYRYRNEGVDCTDTLEHLLVAVVADGLNLNTVWILDGPVSLG